MEDTPRGKRGNDKLYGMLRQWGSRTAISHRPIRFGTSLASITERSINSNPRMFPTAVMAAAQRYFDKWDSLREGFIDSELFVEQQLRPLYAILSCVANALSADTRLSPDGVEVVSSQARSALSRFQRNLGTFRGDRLLNAFLRSQSASGSQPTETHGTIDLPRQPVTLTFESGLRFLTWIRLKLDDNIVKPLLVLCLNPSSAEVVSEELVAALQDSWAAVKVAVHTHSVPLPQDIDSCPALVESHDGRHFPLEDRRSIKEFEAKLARLVAMVRNRNVESDGQVSFPLVSS